MNTYIERVLDALVTDKYEYIEILERKILINTRPDKYKKLTWQLTEEYGKVKQLREHIKLTHRLEEEIL